MILYSHHVTWGRVLGFPPPFCALLIHFFPSSFLFPKSSIVKSVVRVSRKVLSWKYCGKFYQAMATSGEEVVYDVAIKMLPEDKYPYGKDCPINRKIQAILVHYKICTKDVALLVREILHLKSILNSPIQTAMGTNSMRISTPLVQLRKPFAVARCGWPCVESCLKSRLLLLVRQFRLRRE